MDPAQSYHDVPMQATAPASNSYENRQPSMSSRGRGGNRRGGKSRAQDKMYRSGRFRYGTNTGGISQRGRGGYQGL